MGVRIEKKMNARKQVRHTNFQHIVRLLILMEQKQGAVTLNEMAKSLAVSVPTISRLINQARLVYLVKIIRPAGITGTYKIESWGLINRAAVVSDAHKGR